MGPAGSDQPECFYRNTNRARSAIILRLTQAYQAGKRPIRWGKAARPKKRALEAPPTPELRRAIGHTPTRRSRLGLLPRMHRKTKRARTSARYGTSDTPRRRWGEQCCPQRPRFVLRSTMRKPSPAPSSSQREGSGANCNRRTPTSPSRRRIEVQTVRCGATS